MSEQSNDARDENSPSSDSDRRQLKHIELAELTMLELRDVREHVVSDIRSRINENGYNPARPLIVTPEDGEYLVVDGNHRVQALRDTDSVTPSYRVPCVVEHDTDVFARAHAANRDEDTYAAEDLFDHLDYISALREDYTQQQIAERLGWSRSKVNNYTRLLKEVDTDVLELARRHQKSRVSSGDTSVSDFSEGWFRNSGLYELAEREPYALPDEEDAVHPQVRVMQWFIEEENCSASSTAVSRAAEDVRDVCEQLQLLEEELNSGVEDDVREALREDIVQESYTAETLQSAIDNANANAQDRLLFGTDALDGLEDVDDNSVDCVVTDPPYGVDYESHRDTDRPDFPDDERETFELLDDVFAELERVCKANAHIYVFFAARRWGQVRQVAEHHFNVTGVPLVWVKNQHAPTRDAERGFEKMYAQKYEPIFVCRMPNGDSRRLNGDLSPNVLEHAKPSKQERVHEAQKPRTLLAELISNSTGRGETVLDPFAGSGSTLLAAAELGRHYIGFEQSEEYESHFKKQLREINDD